MSEIRVENITNPIIKSIFKTADDNGDGVVKGAELEEAKAIGQEMKSQGTLSAAEYAKFMLYFKQQIPIEEKPSPKIQDAPVREQQAEIVHFTNVDKMNGEQLMKALESIGIIHSEGGNSRETAVGWLKDRYSGYIPVAKGLLKLFEGREIPKEPADGNVSLDMIKSSYDDSGNIEDAFVYRWNEKNGGDRDKKLDWIAPLPK